jgi:hypothetical protein
MTAVELKSQQETGRICSTEEARALSREEVLGAFAVSLVNGLSKGQTKNSWAQSVHRCHRTEPAHQTYCAVQVERCCHVAGRCRYFGIDT